MDVDGIGSLGPGALVGGRFRLASLALRTDNAVVFNALDERSRRRVRVRVTERGVKPELARIDHPAFPEVLGAGGVGGRTWVAFEWFDGRPLTLGATNHEGPWARVADQLVDAIDAFHTETGHPHGALSIESVWIGADGVPRILDGSVPDPAPPAEWASPEHIRGEPIDERSDLYTLAAVLFGLAHGEPPFGTDPIEARSGHLLRRAPQTPVLPPALLAVLRTAMEKQPGHRYPSAAAMRDALAAALAQHSPQRLLVAPVPAPHPLDQLPPAELEQDEGELDADALTPEGTIDAPRPRARATSRAPHLLAFALVGLPLSLLAWTAALGVVWAYFGSY